MISKKPTDISPLTSALGHFHPLNADIENYFQLKLTTRYCRKGGMLLKEGTICESLYFIKKGAIRGFIKAGNKDITTWISIENELVTSIAGLNTQSESLENIQAIENCELLVMSYADLHELYTRLPEFNIVGRKLLQQYYHDAESRAFISRLPATEQKYHHFINRYPHLINRIPIKYIASFLGVTLETLSRVRKRISL